MANVIIILDTESDIAAHSTIQIKHEMADNHQSSDILHHILQRRTEHTQKYRKAIYTEITVQKYSSIRRRQHFHPPSTMCTPYTEREMVSADILSILVHVLLFAISNQRLRLHRVKHLDVRALLFVPVPSRSRNDHRSEQQQHPMRVGLRHLLHLRG